MEYKKAYVPCQCCRYVAGVLVPSNIEVRKMTGKSFLQLAVGAHVLLLSLGAGLDMQLVGLNSGGSKNFTNSVDGPHSPYFLHGTNRLLVSTLCHGGAPPVVLPVALLAL